ncbi:MAG: 50S ribosomal protein L9 [Terriglobales bacterium]
MAMEIILRDDVAKLGRKGDVVKVADGYARNYLLPRRLAILATPGNRNNIEQMKGAAGRKEARDLASARELAAQLEALSLVFARRAGEKDTLFGSVTSMDIGEELTRRGFELDRRRIALPEPIKALGAVKVPVHLQHGVTAELQVEVRRQEDGAEG